MSSLHEAIYQIVSNHHMLVDLAQNSHLFMDKFNLSHNEFVSLKNVLPDQTALQHLLSPEVLKHAAREVVEKPWPTDPPMP